MQRCEAVAELTGVDHRSIGQWSFIERVSTGLFLLRLGHAEEAMPYRQVADLLASPGRHYEP